MLITILDDKAQERQRLRGCFTRFGSKNGHDFKRCEFASDILTLTDPNGPETRAEGESLKLHYVSSMSDQLTGVFSIDPAIFG